jgi:hypothetical protein
MLLWQSGPEGAASTSPPAEVLDPDLARLTALWPDLLEAGRKLLVTTAETLAGQLRRPGKRTRKESGKSAGKKLDGSI